MYTYSILKQIIIIYLLNYYFINCIGEKSLTPHKEDRSAWQLFTRARYRPYH